MIIKLFKRLFPALKLSTSIEDVSKLKRLASLLYHKSQWLKHHPKRAPQTVTKVVPKISINVDQRLPPTSTWTKTVSTVMGRPAQGAAPEANPYAPHSPILKRRRFSGLRHGGSKQRGRNFSQ